MKFTSVYSQLVQAWLNPAVNIIVLQGGKSSSKTWSVLGLLHQVALNSTEPQLISITSESLPHLKKGAIRDYKNILQAEGYDPDSPQVHHRTDHIFKIGKSQIEYFPADVDNSKGPRRDHLYMNEAINCPYEAWDNLMTRTHGKKVLDFNPSWEFWAHEYLQGREDVAWLSSTFIDNEYISEGELQEILRRKDDPKYEKWYKVYGLGLLGQVEGRVYQTWEQTPSIPIGAELLGYGMDFGFANDPTSLVAVYKYRSDVYLDELIYQTGMTTPDIIRLMNILAVDKKKPIFADDSEPRLIKEIGNAGYNIKGQKKENITDSVEFAAKYLKFVTQQSLNLISELRNYLWLEKNGKFINVPIDAFNHALDAMRYAFLGLFGAYFTNQIKGYRVIGRR